MGIGGAPEIKTELFGIHSIFCWYSLSCAVMGKVCALLWVACALLTTGLPSLTGGCGITARVTLMDGTVETAEEARTLALVGEEVTRVEIWCRNAPPPHSIFHDDTVVFRTSSNSPRFVMTGFGLAEQGAYRCDCSGGGNKLNLLLVPGFRYHHFVGTAIEGDTVHLPCNLTNMHPHLSSAYVVEWRRDDEEIGYGNKYSKEHDNSLVIKDFDEEDTGKSFNCYIRKIGSYDFRGEYPESGPRQLLMLEKPDPEILTGGGTVSCSASTPFTASYCLTIIYSDGQRMTKCKRREVKVQASGSIQNIICNVTVFSNASVPQSSLQAIKDWRTTSGPHTGTVTSTAVAASVPLASVILLLMAVIIVVILVLWYCYKKGKRSNQSPEQVDGGESAGGQVGSNEAGPPVGKSPDSPCTALATLNSRPPIPGGSAPSSLAAPLPTGNRPFFIRIPSARKMGSRERPASPAESIHDYMAPLKRQRPTHLKCNWMVYSQHTLPSPPVVPQHPALPAPVVVHFQTGSNVDQLWPRTPPNWPPVHSSRLNTPQNRPAKVSPLALRSQTSVIAEDRTFYAELTPLPQSQEMRIQSNPVVMVSQQPRSNGHDSAMETSSSASSIGQSSPQPSPEGATPQLHLTSSAR